MPYESRYRNGPAHASRGLVVDSPAAWQHRLQLEVSVNHSQAPTAGQFMGIGGGGLSQWTASNGAIVIDIDAYHAVTDAFTDTDQDPHLDVWVNQTFAPGPYLLHVCLRQAGPAGTGPPAVSHIYAEFRSGG